MKPSVLSLRYFSIISHLCLLLSSSIKVDSLRYALNKYRYVKSLLKDPNSPHLSFDEDVSSYFPTSQANFDTMFSEFTPTRLRLFH